jgi:hypothetical protein
MTTLSDAQLVVLSSAANHSDRRIVLPERLRGGAADKVIRALAGKALVEPIDPDMPADGPLSDINGTTRYRITTAGFEALGIELPGVERPAAGSQQDQQQPAVRKRRKQAGSATGRGKADRDRAESESASGQKEHPAPRPGTKLDRLIDLLKQPDGVSIGEAAAALDWMAHSVRGAVAGALKKKFGLTIVSAKIEGRGTVYRAGG